MTTKDKINRKLRSLELCLSAHPDNEPNSEFADRISDIKELHGMVEAYASQFKPKWVKIEDLELTETDTDYLFVDTDGDQWVESVSINTINKARLAYNYVTHFMPLPQPPKENSNKEL